MLEGYKGKFIQMLISSDALKIGGPFELKSRRLSPYFLKMDGVNDGNGLSALDDAYAAAILESIGAGSFDGVFGIPKKAHVFGPGIVISLARQGCNVAYSSYRDVPKTYGDATPTSGDGIEQRQKEYILGAPIRKGSRQVLVDDVMTAGDAKEEALKMLAYLAEDVVVPALVIAANRQEVNEFGGNAIDDFYRSHNIPVRAVIDAGDIFEYLEENGFLEPSVEDAFRRYLRAWGTPEVRKRLGITDSFILPGKGVIPACDVDDKDRFRTIVRATAGVKGIGGYKVGFELGLTYGLGEVVDIVHEEAPGKLVIYDHQKGGTDIGDVQIGRKFARTLARAGVDAVILFPLSGPVTQTAFTGEALQAGLKVVIGGHMTHKGFLARDGGYIRNDAPDEMYTRAARHGIVNFVVPGNNPEAVKHYKELLEAEGVEPSLWGPGFVTQGGNVSETGIAAGDNFQAIVGRDIMNATDPKAAAERLVAQLYRDAA